MVLILPKLACCQGCSGIGMKCSWNLRKCLVPQQYISCWLRFIALQTFLSAEKSTCWSNLIWAGGSSNGRTRIMIQICRMLLSVGLVVTVAAVSFEAFNRFKSLKRRAKYLHIKTPQCIFTVSTLGSAMPSSATCIFLVGCGLLHCKHSCRPKKAPVGQI